MKLFVVFALVAVAAAQNLQDVSAPIIRSDYENNPENFQFAYETGNGISAQADGVVKNPNSDSPALEVKGSYRYTGVDGTPYEVSYVANENGYQPQGSHLPVPPPIPAAIQRSIEYNAAHAVDSTVKAFSPSAGKLNSYPRASLLG